MSIEKHTLTKTEKKLVVNRVRKFVACLLFNDFKVTSICRAIGTTQGTSIKNRTFGYGLAIRITTAYSNHYNRWLKEHRCNGKV